MSQQHRVSLRERFVKSEDEDWVELVPSHQRHHTTTGRMVGLAPLTIAQRRHPRTTRTQAIHTGTVGGIPAALSLSLQPPANHTLSSSTSNSPATLIHETSGSSDATTSPNTGASSMASSPDVVPPSTVFLLPSPLQSAYSSDFEMVSSPEFERESPFTSNGEDAAIKGSLEAVSASVPSPKLGVAYEEKGKTMAIQDDAHRGSDGAITETNTTRHTQTRKTDTGGKELSTTGRPITLPLVHRRNERPKASLWRLVHRSFEKVGYFSLRMAWDLSNVWHPAHYVSNSPDAMAVHSFEQRHRLSDTSLVPTDPASMRCDAAHGATDTGCGHVAMGEEGVMSTQMNAKRMRLVRLSRETRCGFAHPYGPCIESLESGASALIEGHSR